MPSGKMVRAFLGTEVPAIHRSLGRSLPPAPLNCPFDLSMQDKEYTPGWLDSPRHGERKGPLQGTTNHLCVPFR